VPSFEFELAAAVFRGKKCAKIITLVSPVYTTMVSNQLPIFQYKQLADFIHTFTQISYIQSHRFLYYSTVLYKC
jgi:hypothetical protein